MTFFKNIISELAREAGLDSRRPRRPSLFTAPPPVPRNEQTGNVNKVTEESKGEYDILSPRLNSLIAAAIADGVITDMERQVLLRNAQQENVPEDEFMMILEARLFEQRRLLQTREEEMLNRTDNSDSQQTAGIATSGSIAPPPLPQEARRSVIKCPHCNAPLKSLATSCPECGYDYINVHTGNLSSWERLAIRIKEISNSEIKPGEDIFTILDFSRLDDPNRDKNLMIISALNSWPVPSDKQDIVDFMTGCAPLGKPSGFFDDKGMSEKQLEKAYYNKAQQVLLKARIVLKDDPSLLNEIEMIARQYKIKV